MRGWLVVLLIAAALAPVPAASAHDCNGRGCGPCPRGEYHNHNDWSSGQCSSAPGFRAENSRDGQRAEVPFPDLALALVAVGLAVTSILWLKRVL